MLADKLRSATAAPKTYVDDVFSTWLYDGNGSTQTITNGIDLAGKGGMVWVKSRSNTGNHILADTVRGAGANLSTNLTDAQYTGTTNITAFGSTGFTVGANLNVNTSGQIYTSWTFRNAPKFFTHTTISHTNGTSTNISLTDLGTVGMVVAKITNTTGDWITWHRSLTAGNNLRLNTTAAQSTTNAWLSVSGTTATLASGAPTGTYVIYAWAHDTASDGMVQCGMYTTSVSGQTINLGWEPQFLLLKDRNAVRVWTIVDSMRGITDASSHQLRANETSAETNPSATYPLTATGFRDPLAVDGNEVIYLAIRIPNKPPTSGTEVFQPTVYTGTNVDNRLVNTGIKTDMAWFRMRSGSGAGYEGFVVGDRLRGQGWLKTGATQEEISNGDSLDQQIVSTTEYGTAFSSMTGVWVGNNTGTAASNVNINADTTASNHVVEAFKRAPGFMDIVCYTGTGTATTTSSALFSHQLGVVPELVLVKRRSAAGINWCVSTSAPSAQMLRLNGTEASTTANNVANITANGYVHMPTCTATQFAVRAGTTNAAAVDASGLAYVAYLFATLPGISKVGSYTGNGSSQTIDCGFTTGARFVLIKRTDTTGDWYVLDTARGIVSGNDPFLRANSATSEIITVDVLDPDNSGFIVNQEATYNLNVNTGTYIYLAIA